MSSVCVCVCLSVCLYVCMYLRRYVCMCVHVCLITCMRVCMHVCIYIYVRKYVSIFIWASVCLFVCGNICMHVCLRLSAARSFIELSSQPAGGSQVYIIADSKYAREISHLSREEHCETAIRYGHLAGWPEICRFRRGCRIAS